MSEWGKKYADDVMLTLGKKGGKLKIAETVEEMSQFILDIEQETIVLNNEISNLKDKLLDAEIKKGLARAAEAHMSGYIQRVRELDPGERHRQLPDPSQSPRKSASQIRGTGGGTIA